MTARVNEPVLADPARADASTSSEVGVGVESEAGARPSVELRARLRGVGLWTPSFPSLEAWLDGGAPTSLPAEVGPPRPPALLLHPRLRRRTSTLTRAAVTALEAALGHSGGSVSEVRFVLVSSFGEIETTVALLEQLADPQGPVSPTKFHNSVHNTATGYLSIASGNNREATALAGGPHNLEIGLLEAFAGLAEDGTEVVLIFAEERLPEPFARPDADPTFAVALHLTRADLTGPGPGPGSASSSELDLALSLAPRELGPRSGPRGPVGVGVGGEGLSRMASPLLELLRLLTSRDVDGREVELSEGHDPGVEASWRLRVARP